MCDTCGYRICPPTCPEYTGISAEHGAPVGRCARCGGYVYRSEILSSDFGKPYCRSCRAETARIRRARNRTYTEARSYL